MNRSIAKIAETYFHTTAIFFNSVFIKGVFQVEKIRCFIELCSMNYSQRSHYDVVIEWTNQKIATAIFSIHVIF